MEFLLKGGYSYQVPRQEVEKAIVWIRGIDERTAKRWLKALTLMEYLTQVNKNVYEMNIVKVPGLFKLLRNQPQTHLSTLSLSQSSTTTKQKENTI